MQHIGEGARGVAHSDVTSARIMHMHSVHISTPHSHAQARVFYLIDFNEIYMLMQHIG